MKPKPSNAQRGDYFVKQLHPDPVLYVYSVNGNYQGDHLYCLKLGQNDRRVTDIAEAMAYVTQTRSFTAGRVGDTAGSISDRLALPSLCDYGPEPAEHSAEWVWSIQDMYPCFKEILRKFQLPTIGE